MVGGRSNQFSHIPESGAEKGCKPWTIARGVEGVTKNLTDERYEARRLLLSPSE